MQKHAGALGTWAGERRSTRIPFLWDLTIGAGPTQEASARRDALQNRGQGYIRGQPD